jgi:Protein of unknown function (DUF3152)
MAGQRQRLLLVGLLAVALMAAIWASSRDDGAEPKVSAPTASTTATADRPTSVGSSSPTATSAIDVAGIAPTDRFVTAPGGSPVVGSGTLHTYVVEVEEGIPVDAAELAAAVDDTLADPRGWTAPGDLSLQRVGTGEAPSFRVRLATPATVDAHCAPLETDGIYSCRQGADVMINVVRWLEGATASRLGLDDYKHYVISHEVGHALGHGHVGCPGPGAVAPVMMQQTKGIGGCSPNPWPYP